MLRKYALVCLCAMLPVFAQTPLSFLAPQEVQDYVKGKNKSGIIVGVGLGLPSLATQHISGQVFHNMSSYGYHIIAGYQDFSRLIGPLPRNFGGARASLEFSDNFHNGAGLQPTIRSSSFWLNYDLLFDPFARRSDVFGLLLGVSLGWTSIRGYQDFSFSAGLKFGFSINFDKSSRLEITYRLAQSGPLKGKQLYFYSPYTINLTYTYRFDVPKWTKPKSSIYPHSTPSSKKSSSSELDFDNTKLLIKN